MNKATKIIALTAIVSLVGGGGSFGLLLASGWPNYGTCANGTFKIAKVYKSTDDQVISENSKNYMLHPFNKMGDVIPKDKALFIAFATYGEKKPLFLSVTVEELHKEHKEGLGAGAGIFLNQDLSILYPTKIPIDVGSEITMRLVINQPAGTGFYCNWQGIVEGSPTQSKPMQIRPAVLGQGGGGPAPTEVKLNETITLEPSSGAKVLNGLLQIVYFGHKTDGYEFAVQFYDNRMKLEDYSCKDIPHAGCGRIHISEVGAGVGIGGSGTPYYSFELTLLEASESSVTILVKYQGKL